MQASPSKVPLFYQKISELVEHAHEQGLAPEVHIDRRTVTKDHDARTLIERASDVASYGPMGRWFLGSALAASAGFMLHFTFNKLPEVSTPAPIHASKPITKAGAAKGIRTAPNAARKPEAQLVEVNGIRMVPVLFQGESIHTVHPEDRIALAKSAAQAENLDKWLGKGSWKTVYGVITAESNWIARNGMGNNRRASYGVAQIEMPTAKALGVDPHDPIDAAKAVAMLVKEAARAYAQKKSQGFEVTDTFGRPLPHKAALTTYISVHYNTSSRFRGAWEGNLADLPPPTQAHIRNVEFGVGEARSIESQVGLRKLVSKQANHMLAESERTQPMTRVGH
jgi:hypothetical protein